MTTSTPAPARPHRLEQLALLPFLAASPFPAAILPLPPLQDALATRNSMSPVRTPQWRGNELSGPLGRLGVNTPPHVPSAGGTPTPSRGDTAGDYFSVRTEGVAAVMRGLLRAMEVEWANDAFCALRGKAEGAREDKGKRRQVEEYLQMEGSRSGSGSFGRGGGIALDGKAQLSFLDLDEQDELLAYLLDVVDAVDEPPEATKPPSSLRLSTHVFSATLVPSYLVLTLALPQPPVATANRIPTLIFNTIDVTPVAEDASRVCPLPSPSGETLPADPYLQALSSTVMGRLIRHYDWSSSALGPIETWGPELKTMLSSVLTSPFRECILWGEDQLVLYNDEYIATAGGKHPHLLGAPAAVGWAEIWTSLDPVAKRVMKGETVFFNDHFLPMRRHGTVEETYHTFSYSPFRNTSGEILGIRNFSYETTATVIAARRLGTVRDLVQMTSLARTVGDFAESALESVAANAYDLPFVLLYTVQQVSAKPTTREVRTGLEEKLRLGVKVSCCGSLGVPVDHPFNVPDTVIDLTPPMSRQSSASGSGSSATAMEMDSDPPAWTWPFEEACLRREPVLVEDLGPLAATLDRRGWEEPPRHAVVIPIVVEAGQTIPQAVLVLGVNPRSAFDELYSTFFKLIARHVAIGLFAVMTAEMDAKRSEELIKLDKAKTNFFNNVSHELRTPLTLILGPLDDVISSKERVGAEHREKLVLVQRHANRLLAMVNKLLDFSSLEGGRMQVKFRPVQLGVLTRDLATLFRDAIERGGLQYIVHCEDDPPDALPMYIASDLWEKVVYNLVGNALKYCRTGSIEVILHSSVAEAVLSVRDTGVGIPADDLSRIFERFHRVDDTARTTSGTGIGLALTLEIVKVLGGQLELESEPGRGSTFFVRLPRGFTHLPIEQVSHQPEAIPAVPVPIGRSLAAIDEAMSGRYDFQDEPLSSASSSSGSASGRSGSAGHSSGEDFVDSARLLNLANKTILLAEDSLDLRVYISSILSKSFNVVQVPDGQAALDYALRHPPSLIVTDQMMPKMTGNELITALRANPSTALIPVIMLSAEAGSEARAEALEMGFDDYLVKPFQARELLARVNVHMQLGLLRIELEKRVQERTCALIDSETRNRALADKFSTLSTVSPVGIVQADAPGNIIYANPRWFEITSHPLERPLSEWRDCVLQDDAVKIDAVWDAAIAAGHSSPSHLENLEIRFKNGRWGQFEIRSFNGVRDGFVAVVTDITRQKTVEALHIQTVEQRAADAEENRRNTEIFLDMSSHELRNPLSGVWQNAEVIGHSLDGIAGLIDDLCAGKMPEQRVLEDARREMQENAEAIESIILCASHQGRIADDILNVSKLNMGLLSINPTPFDLTVRMSEVLRMFEVECNQKKISLRLSVGDSIAALGASWITADPSRLSQILLNFISNSVKYTADSAQRRIVVHLDAFDSPPPAHPGVMRVSEPPLDVAPNAVWIVVGVEDSGKGLSSDELKKLFARFSQANPRSDQYGGSGLGLFVSKQLVALHSGFIEVESVVGAGSIFRFAIPAALASPPARSSPTPPPPVSVPMIPSARTKRAAPTRPPLSRTPSTKSAKTGDPRPPIRILVAEDNIINQKVMTRQLKLAGYEVTVANNGREALDLLLAESTKTPNVSPIAMVLMDIEMPVMGGLEAIRTLRGLERTHQVPIHYTVVAVTGNARQAQIDECLASGFDETAIKPYVFADLLSQIKRYTAE